jgi:two-component system sensor histidine kinase/response regulator
MNPSPQSHKQALIIDDSEDMQELLTLLLESQGYETKCSSNGEEALDLLNSGRSLPSVILLDLRMPVMDGKMFLDLKKQSAKLKDIPTIMMTAEDDIEFLKANTNLCEILVKPLSMGSLLSAVVRSTHLH